MTASSLQTPQILLFDADDTLWENNIYFERAIAQFISFLDHRVHTPAEVREHLNRCERATIARHGYGVGSFRRSLTDCFEQLSSQSITAGQHARIAAFAASIADQEIELLPEVEPTLRTLALRHRLILVTKGNREEQLQKFSNSGLQTFFAAAEVLPEKNEPAFRDLLQRHGFAPHITWMIGNSPRSDVNPALSAGLNAVYVPHVSTWALEHETLADPPPGRTLLHLPSFGELAMHF